jgi:hypothetical protein
MLSIPVAFIAPVISALIFFAVAGLWFVPDSRIERLASMEELERSPTSDAST